MFWMILPQYGAFHKLILAWPTCKFKIWRKWNGPIIAQDFQWACVEMTKWLRPWLVYIRWPWRLQSCKHFVVIVKYFVLRVKIHWILNEIIEPLTMDVTVCRENYGSQPVKKKYLKTSGDTLLTIDESPKYTSVSQFFRVSGYMYINFWF